MIKQYEKIAIKNKLGCKFSGFEVRSAETHSSGLVLTLLCLNAVNTFQAAADLSPQNCQKPRIE